MFLQIPKFESYVPGITLLCEVVPENIANDYQQHRLVDEHLRLWVEHDGTNPFCDSEECYWCLIFAMSATEIAPNLSADDDVAVQLLCLPHGIFITEAIVSEETHEGITGIWLLLATNDDSGEYDFAFSLTQYSLQG